MKTYEDPLCSDCHLFAGTEIQPLGKAELAEECPMRPWVFHVHPATHPPGSEATALAAAPGGLSGARMVWQGTWLTRGYPATLQLSVAMDFQSGSPGLRSSESSTVLCWLHGIVQMAALATSLRRAIESGMQDIRSPMPGAFPASARWTQVPSPALEHADWDWTE